MSIRLDGESDDLLSNLDLTNDAKVFIGGEVGLNKVLATNSEGTIQYANNDFISSTIFAGFTDGYHSTILARNLFITTSICLSPQTRGWKPFLTKTLIYSLSYGLGFELVYAKLIK